MYPDWPSSAADLVPLPQCFGPKLKPFDFQGPQSIDFLEFLGDGLHSFVFKVKILGRIYALKLFRFEYVSGWDGIPNDFDRSDITALTTIYNYSEPFNRECRSFGRLQEAGYEELAVQCFGYLLLDQEHERAMRAKFGNMRHVRLEFDGNSECPGYEDVRGSFPGRSGRPPPIRGIVKEFGLGVEELKTRDMKRLFRTMTQLQQLGIINLDVADRQLIGGKICDFSTAITVPHPVTTPELNPHLYLESESLHVLQLGTFLLCMNDYWTFDDMVRLWNEEHEDQKTEISARAYPSGYGCRFDYNLRNTPSRARVYTFVDPRKYDWKARTGTPAPDAARTRHGPQTRQRTKSRAQATSTRGVSKTRPRLDKRPPRWYLDCDPRLAAGLKEETECIHPVQWHAKSGLIYPRMRENLSRWMR